jgi:hypothetical protein
MSRYLIGKLALIFSVIFSSSALILLVTARSSGTASVYGSTVTLKQVGTCSIIVDSDRTWTVVLENRWNFSVHIPDHARFRPKPCAVYSIIFYRDRAAILATVQVTGGLIPILLSREQLF